MRFSLQSSVFQVQPSRVMYTERVLSQLLLQSTVLVLCALLWRCENVARNPDRLTPDRAAKGELPIDLLGLGVRALAFSVGVNVRYRRHSVRKSNMLLP